MQDSKHQRFPTVHLLVSADKPTEIYTIQINLRKGVAKQLAREGVATDGVAKLVIRYPVPSAGVVQFSIVDENGSLSCIVGTQGCSANSSGGVTISVVGRVSRAIDRRAQPAL